MTATVLLLASAACSSPATALGPSAEAARSFRPVSELFFLPDRAPPIQVDGAALVPDSKILWDLSVTAKNLGLSGVKITVHRQQVRLEGSVPSAEAHSTLLRVAKRTPGVRTVIENVEVAQ